MLSNTLLPQGSLYDPNTKIQYFNGNIDQIRFQLSGTSRLYCDKNFFYKSGYGIVWRRPHEICGNPFFFKGRPERFDVIQGNLGDCYLLSAFQSLTLGGVNDRLIEHVIPPNQSFYDNYVGAFHFRIWSLGTWYDVVVDDLLPIYFSNHRLCYAHSEYDDIFWASLLEKAYAAFHGYSYSNLTGGFCTAAMQDLTGGIVERVFTYAPPAGTTVKWFLRQIERLGSWGCCVCFADVKHVRNDLLARHGYSITGVFITEDSDPAYHGLTLVRLKNPAFYPEWKGDWSDHYKRWKEIDRGIRRRIEFIPRNDGEFWIDLENFERYFNQLFICHLGPGQYEESRHGDNIKSWKTTTFRGEWVNWVSAGGSTRRHQNPQYRISLNRSYDDSNWDGKCSLVIELVQKSKYKRTLIREIGFYIYQLTHIRDPPTPLDNVFFETNTALNEKDVVFGDRGSPNFVIRTNLDPGKYCIVPCTKNRNEEQQFLLRVFTESSVNMWEHDTQISKSPVVSRTSPIEADSALEKLYYQVGDSQGRVDSIGLKTVLNKVMNQSNSTSLIITKLKKLFWEVAELFFPFTNSDDFDTEEVVFSKDDCRSMIAMLDSDRSGKLSISEFNHLWSRICFWVEVYNQHVDETEKNMAVSELKEALGSTGYNINKKILHVLIHRYENEQAIISLQDFILCAVSLETAMELFHQKNCERKEEITFTLEDWVKNIMYL